MQMSKNTFPPIARKGVGLSFQALTKHQNGVFCFHIATVLLSGYGASGQTQRRSLEPGQGLGLTGLEPVTLRLSSACSNQLSYRPGVRSQHAQVYPPGRWKPREPWSDRLGCFQPSRLSNQASSKTKGKERSFGGKGIRTPDL